MKIEIKHLEKKFPDVTPLTDVNAVINDGDIIPVIGPSGTGKSTFLRCINMIDPPTAGEIYIDGLEITKNKANFKQVRQRMGMVFQSFNLFGHLSALENVMCPLTELKKLSRQEAYDIAMERLGNVGLADKALKFPNELSGGQKQRVSIARTLAMDPDLILLDEPTSALDPTMVREVESVIMRLAETGKTMMIVTHEMRLAKAIGNRIFYLDRGTLYEEGTPEQIFEHPQRERTRAFVNRMRVFKYKFRTDEFSYGNFQRSFAEFIENSGLSDDAEHRLSGVMADIAEMLVPAYIGNPAVLSVIAEKYPDENRARLLIYCNRSETGLSDTLDLFMRKYAGQVNAEAISDEEFNCKLTGEF